MSNLYSISELVKNSYSYLLTKIFYPKARLIRRPVNIRGKKSIVGAENLTIGYGCRFDLDGKNKTLFIGKNCEFGDYTHIVALHNVQIGNNVLIASKVFISDTSHGKYSGHIQDDPKLTPSKRNLDFDKVIIGDNVWIGENVVILKGVSIGEGCIIGANAVVTKSIEKNTIAVGIPAKPIKRFEKNMWRYIK